MSCYTIINEKKTLFVEQTFLFYFANGTFFVEKGGVLNNISLFIIVLDFLLLKLLHN